jgi:Fe-S-cluster-containing hydrogenase component 2
MDPVYQKLAKKLDDLPPGFPAHPDGVELRILQNLFTPEEAALALHLELLGAEADVVAHRAGLPVEVTEQRLEDMVRKGLIYCYRPKNKPVQYQIVYFAVGIWEFQVNRLNPELVQLVDQYLEFMITEHDMWKTSAQLRTIPIGESIPTTQTVMIYEQAEEIIRAQERILVAPCICRRERGMVGESCGKPSETCLIFNSAADYYHHNGLGRWIDTKEALEILAQANQAGLVLQPTNDRHVGGMCCCCGDCCGVLRNLNRLPRPADVAVSAFQAHFEPELCAACETCLMRCQMAAITAEDGEITLHIERCIGCGLCVTTCTTGALTLVRKPEAEQPAVPKTVTHNAFRMWSNRERLDLADLAKLGLRSKMDRLVASLKK